MLFIQKLVNLLKAYRIGEETAITLADRIADTYGAQRYMDGLCDGVKQEQPEVDLEREAIMFCFDNGINITPYQAKEIARHFYELGLNAN